MPKIVIREFDKTTAVSAPYANFAVVVPGFAKEGTTCFDENGVYECNNRDEFRENVGLIKPVKHKVADAKAPEWATDWEPTELTEAEFTDLVAKGTLYVVTPSTSVGIGELKDSEYEYTLAVSENTAEYIFKPTEEVELTDGEETPDYTKFVVLADIGYDEVVQNHYGNQIAWELLGLGYTVLYKELKSTDYLEQESFWKPLKDKSTYDFRYIISGLLAGNSTIYTNMANVASFTESAKFDDVNPLSAGRGDCIALFDIDESNYKGKSQLDAIDSIIDASIRIPKTKYAAVFAPTVTYAVVDEEKSFGNRTFPASFHYLACAARSYENYNEWYANAGYTRGISKYTIESVGCKFGEAAVNALQRRFKAKDGKIEIAINPIINLRGSYYIWGNRTAEGLGSEGTADGDLKASHFLNIRQLCSTIKKQVYVACRQLTFNPNSDVLWVDFCNSIKPMLEKMKADQGISDYKILKVKNARKAFLSAIIRIVPIEAVEDFDISIYLEDSIGGTMVEATEE